MAKDFQDSGLIFAIADEEEYANDLKALGLADWGEDVAVGLFAPGPLKYNMKEELTPESLREWPLRQAGELPLFLLIKDLRAMLSE